MKLNRQQAANLSEMLTIACKEQRALIALERTDPEKLMQRQQALNEAFFIIGDLENELKDTTKTEIII
jgi:hypothetical protein